MKMVLSKKAFTLIELIVSSLLVAVVIMGIFSINTVLTNNNQDYGQRYLVKSETQIVLDHILNNAALAYGSVIGNDEGILIGSAAVDPAKNTFCIHQPASNNQIGYASDIWLCYTWSSNYEINWCAEKYPAAAVTDPGSVADPRGASSCSSAPSASLLDNPATGKTTTFLGTSYNSFASSPPTFSSNATQTLFSITIQNCLNNSSSTCKSGSSTDQTDNPEVQLSGSVIPLQVSSN